MEQSAFTFDESAPRPPSIEQGAEMPLDAWADSAVDACFGGQKTRWKALSDEQRQGLKAAMWGYSLARERALAAPLCAAEAEPALLGWLSDAVLAHHVRVLHAHMVNSCDIPRPVASLLPA